MKPLMSAHAAVHESVFGTKRTIQQHPRLSAFGPKQTKVNLGRGSFVCE